MIQFNHAYKVFPNGYQGLRDVTFTMKDGVQLYGGYGYMNEYRVARAWRDARVTKIWAGSNEIMKELIGRDLGL